MGDSLPLSEFVRFFSSNDVLPLSIYQVKLSNGTMLQAVRIMGEWEDRDGRCLSTVVEWAFFKCIPVEPKYSKS